MQERKHDKEHIRCARNKVMNSDGIKQLFRPHDLTEIGTSVFKI